VIKKYRSGFTSFRGEKIGVLCVLSVASVNKKTVFWGCVHGLFIWIQYRRIIMEKGLFEFAAISSTNPGRVG